MWRLAAAAFTNACRDSEVIVYLRPPAHKRRQHREPIIDTTGLQHPAGGVLVEQRNAEDGRGLEGEAQRNRQIAALDLAHRHMRDADPLGQLL